MMKKFNRLLQLVVFALVYTIGGLQVAYGEDTEIFFAPAEDLETDFPNIMFIIDSSGSMGWGVAGTTDSRMEVVQDVMDEVLTNISNVNAGLMRFNNGKPGSVLYPILNLDQQVTPTAFQSITAGGNDASETTLLGVVDIVGATLEFNGANDYVGLRFEHLNIPQGATILSASVVFTADRDASGAASVLITGENVDSAAYLSGAASELSNRALNGTTASQIWTMEDWGNGGIYASSDISNVVEEVTSRAGWCGGNDLMLFFQQQSGAGTSRNAYSKDGVDANSATIENIFSPRIKIEYSPTFVGTANKCLTSETVSQISAVEHDFEVQDNGNINSNSPDLGFNFDSGSEQDVGMAFENIKVPQDATILYAYLSFSAKNNSNVATFGSTDVIINAVNQDSIALPSGYTDYFGLHIAGTTSSISWEITGDWVAGNTYNSPDISSIITEVTGRAGWALGNNISLFIRGSSGRGHEADSYPGSPPKLHIGYQGAWEPGVNTIRDDLKAAVAGLVPSGGTPISGTMAEAGTYFRGDPIFYGATRYGNRHSRVSHELSYSAAGTVVRDANCTDSNLDAEACKTEVVTGSPNYVSPITDSCQSSHIVYLTDGSSNSHLESTNTIYSAWTGGSSCSSSDLGGGGNDCSIKMAGWLHTKDVAPNVLGDQHVSTHMIGFGPGADPALMEAMADAGGGGYYTPSDRVELVAAIESIVDDISSVNTTFVTSGVTVNQYNRLTHNDELYFSLFTPDAATSWPGNIKRYQLKNGAIVDSQNPPADAVIGGKFLDTAISFWSSQTDGNNVELGGAAEQLGLGRKVYSNISGGDLNDIGNAVKQSNPSITTEILGSVTPQRRDSILYWAEGYDVNDPSYDPADSASLTGTPARKNIGDPLHSQPTVLQYNNAAGVVSSRIYVGTNHGYLHSFDASNGEEAWAFIPKDLLPRLDSVIDTVNGAHTYGLDGSVAISLKDENGNGAVDPGDKAYLYIGQRRGGRNYYAIDISEKDNPQLMFQIEGGLGVFASLGETWSRPTIVKMNLSGVNSDKLVMIFGGGYDDDQDTEGGASLTDDVGNIVYIVDALTGSLLWNSVDNTEAHGGSAGAVSTMNSVPSNITAFDLNDDELIDHMYVTDTKSQVFRFDVDNDTGKIKGGRIAHLNGDGAIANNRRFYYSADTALIRQVGDSFISVSIGSGYRAHPLDVEIDDNFYVLKDKGVLNGVFDMDAALTDLQDVTSLVDTDSNGVSDAVEILNDVSNSKKGWYISFATKGEKVIERSITFNNAVIFTSYLPLSDGDKCKSAVGGGRLYALNILNGNPYVDNVVDGLLEENDRYIDLLTDGIAPPPQVFIDDDLIPRLCVGIECEFDDILPPISDGLMGIKWRRN